MKKLLIGLMVLGMAAMASAELIISQYVETSSGTVPKGIELWNTGVGTIDFSSTTLDILVGVNGGALASVFTLNIGTLAAGAVMVVGTTDMVAFVDNAYGGSVLTELEPFTFNGDDALQIQLGAVVQDTFGLPLNDPGTGWAGSGVQTYNQNISLLGGITTGDTDGWSDPSTRFETTYVNPVPGAGLDGFGAAPIPEPTTFALFGIAIGVLVGMRRRIA